MSSAAAQILNRIAHSRAALVWAWLLTRAAVVTFVLVRAVRERDQLQDINYYVDVARHVVATHTMPITEMWQYPPGALAVLVPPRLLVGDASDHLAYGIAFIALMLVCDAVITWLLARQARLGGALLGVWAWILVLPAMREYTLLRFDLAPTLLAVAALTMLAARRPIWMGVLIGAGALVKAWPIVLLAGEWTRRRLAIASLAAVVTIIAGFGLAQLTLGDQHRALDNQAERGLQQESVAATWFHLRDVLGGDPPVVVQQYGSLQVQSDGVPQILDALRIATLAMLVLLAAWWLLRDRQLHRGSEAARARFAHLATVSASLDFLFVALLGALATSRVLSPQFLPWALALGALAVSWRGSSMRRAFLITCAATMLALVLYQHPFVYVVRNALLFAALIDGAIQLVRLLAPREAAAPATPPR